MLVSGPAMPATLALDAANDATDPPNGKPTPAHVLRAQVLLERAHFSPGEIDGRAGSNLARALRGWQQRNGVEASGKLDAATWDALVASDPAPVLVDYTIADADVAGPFEEIPEDMMDKATLKAMGYESAVEALGEKFHAAPSLLEALNPGATFAAGDTIEVPSVDGAPLPKAARVVVDRSDSTLSLQADDGTVFAQYPATTGSEHDPLPIGEWKIRGVATNPQFHYNPELFWDADATDEKATIAPGPNNPVGVAWIDLDIPHYGIHGTPEPATLAKTASHGCIRLANWSVAEVAQSVVAGTPATLQE
ncbi:MAG TPA: L,D-transpeptidase [Xanthomonadales bacterium]|nr:L,D-transpeptidase [Xanthomonadales bacterium]